MINDRDQSPALTGVCFDTDLIVRYGGRGPRYTSYPTALQFNDGLTADDYRRHAIASNDTDVPLSLYVHIPFCHSLCYYCGCNKIVTHNQRCCIGRSRCRPACLILAAR
jgi:oxygen-independent coproporphyrinogen-3 oxidase